MLRGINKQNIFEGPAGYLRFLAILSEVKKLSGFKLFTYCLMGNDVRMLIQEGEESLPQIVKRITARHVFWFNMKHDRNGPLFQGRFRSEPVD